MKMRKPKLDWIEEVLGRHGQDGIKRRVGLAKNIGKAHEARSRTVLGLEKIDGTILQFEPDRGRNHLKNAARKGARQVSGERPRERSHTRT